VYGNSSRKCLNPNTILYGVIMYTRFYTVYICIHGFIQCIYVYTVYTVYICIHGCIRCIYVYTVLYGVYMYSRFYTVYIYVYTILYGVYMYTSWKPRIHKAYKKRHKNVVPLKMCKVVAKPMHVQTPRFARYIVVPHLWWGRLSALRANVSPSPSLMQGVFCCLRSFSFLSFSFSLTLTTAACLCRPSPVRNPHRAIVCRTSRALPTPL
jgi:hypothetical protein